MSPGASQISISISDPRVPWTWVVIVVYDLFYLLLNLQFSLKIKSYPLLVCEIRKDEFYTEDMLLREIKKENAWDILLKIV